MIPRSDKPTLIARLYAAPIRHPRWALAIAAGLCVVSLLAIRRVRFDSSLEPLFPRGDPATTALTHVLNDFSAVDDLLILVSLPGGTAGPGGATADQSARLTDYAARLEHAVSQDPEAASMVASLTYHAGAEGRQFIQEVVIPSGIYYLDDQQFEVLRARLSPAGIREQIHHDETLLATPSPAAGAIAKTIVKDPLNLHEFLLDRLGKMLPSGFRKSGGGAFLSTDGGSLLVRVGGVRPASDLEFTRRFVDAMNRVAKSAHPGGLDVEFSGGYAIADVAHRVIRHDIIVNILGSVAVLVLLFLAAYTRVWYALIVLLPVGIGTLLGFGAFAAIDPRLTPVGAGIGSILAGIGVDYSILYLSHYERHRSMGLPSEQAMNLSGGIGADVTLACLTSLAAFVAIGTSSLPALRNFAALGALGLAGVYLATVTVLPAVLMLADRHPQVQGTTRSRLKLDRMVGAINHRPRTFLCAGVVIGVLPTVVLIALFWPRDGVFESDLAVMHPRPNPPLDVQRRIAERFPGAMGSLAIHLHAGSPEALLTLAKQVDERLARPQVRRVGVQQSLGVGTLLPDPATVRRRRDQIAQIDVEGVLSDLHNALNDSAFDPAEFGDYFIFLRKAVESRDAPDIRSLYRFPGMTGALLPKAAFEPEAGPTTQAITLAMLRAPFADRQERDRAVEVIRGVLADLPGATLTGMSVVSHDVEASVRRDLPRLSGVAAVLVIVILLLGLRRLAPTLLAMLPMLVGVLYLLSAMAVMGVRFNIVNLVALPLLAGVGVDYGIYLVGVSIRAASAEADAARESVLHRYATSGRAVVMCAATVLLGFGSLMFTHTRAMQSLGLVLAVSITGALVGTFFVLLPILLLQGRGGRPDTITP